MNTSTSTNTRGFTIIEVVLVLAIAGLIFLLVFLAVPALQRSQRDTQRRSDMGRLNSQIQNFQANNKGLLPADTLAAMGTTGTFTAGYLTTGVGDTWSDPSTGNTYQWATTTNSTTLPVGSFEYQINARCTGENITTGGGARKYAIRTKLEGAGFYCSSN